MLAVADVYGMIAVLHVCRRRIESNGEPLACESILSASR
jgi:hypothetical protein